MKEIPLNKPGFVALVDDEDYEELSKYHWMVVTRDNKTFYAVRTPPRNGAPRKRILMHRQLMPRAKDRIDHIDHNGLNNQKSNLRPASAQQNARNCIRTRKNCVSQYKGVTWSKGKEKWMAQIKFGQLDNGKAVSVYLGYFDSELAAAKAYDIASLDMFGAFASTNMVYVDEM